MQLLPQHSLNWKHSHRTLRRTPKVVRWVVRRGNYYVSHHVHGTRSTYLQLHLQAHTPYTDYYAERLLQVQVSLRTSSNTRRYLLRVLVLLCNRNTFRLCAVQCYESYYYGNIGNYVQQCVFQSLVTSDNVISVGRVLQLALALIGFLIRFVQHVELWSLRSKLQIIRLWGYGLLICKLKTN